MSKTQTPEYFAAKVAAATSDTAQMYWVMKAEAALPAEELAKFFRLVKSLYSTPLQPLPRSTK